MPNAKVVRPDSIQAATCVCFTARIQYGMRLCPTAFTQARLLCLSLGEAFCAHDAAGQEAAAELLRDASRWAADDRLQVGGKEGLPGC